jgi:hypothetical protein
MLPDRWVGQVGASASTGLDPATGAVTLIWTLPAASPMQRQHGSPVDVICGRGGAAERATAAPSIPVDVACRRDSYRSHFAGRGTNA